LIRKKTPSDLAKSKLKQFVEDHPLVAAQDLPKQKSVRISPESSQSNLNILKSEQIFENQKSFRLPARPATSVG